MDRETAQKWQDMLSLQAWKAYTLLVREQENKALAALLAQARSKDYSNGYWAGYYEGLEKAISIPKEEMSKNDRE